MQIPQDHQPLEQKAGKGAQENMQGSTDDVERESRSLVYDKSNRTTNDSLNYKLIKT
jgi:hypothetical protein